jgi:hypothetical protein
MVSITSISMDHVYEWPLSWLSGILALLMGVP